jgi:hypothetical protein
MRPYERNAVLFKNREFRIRVVKPEKDEPDVDQFTEESHIDPEQIATISKDFVTHTVVTIAVAVFSYKVLSTICEIAVKKA